MGIPARRAPTPARPEAIRSAHPPAPLLETRLSFTRKTCSSPDAYTVIDHAFGGIDLGQMAIVIVGKLSDAGGLSAGIGRVGAIRAGIEDDAPAVIRQQHHHHQRVAHGLPSQGRQSHSAGRLERDIPETPGFGKGHNQLPPLFARNQSRDKPNQYANQQDVPSLRLHPAQEINDSRPRPIVRGQSHQHRIAVAGVGVGIRPVSLRELIRLTQRIEMIANRLAGRIRARPKQELRFHSADPFGMSLVSSQYRQEYKTHSWNSRSYYRRSDRKGRV